MLVPAGRIPPRVAAVEIGVVLAEAGADLSALDERFAAAGVPWLHASIDVTAGTALLGPYFDPHHTLCYPCFRAGAAAAVPPSSEGEGEEEALAARTLADLLTMQALYALGSTAPLAVGQTCTRYRIDEWTAEEDAVAARLPDCPRCSSAVQSPPPTSAAAERVEPDPALVLAAAYEDLAGFPAYQVTPKAHQAHYRVQNIALTGEAKHYRCASHVALPAADPLSALTASREPTRRMGVDELALLLRLVGGVRAFPEAGGGKLRRWAPTGGNLGSVELYVVVNDVVGVEPGSWYYDPHLHALARLHERSDGGQAPFPRHLASAGDELAAAVLVLGAAYHRVARKYGPRAYRIVHLDAGVALAQLDAVAAALGIGVEVAEGFDEEAAARWLDLSPPMEMVTAMVALAPGPRAAGKTTSELDLEMEAVPC
ncbi:MAG: SagB family peptide dehydrogenase [Gemmatimonadetes bacterium]|nr:SagB family peptide dehydrogenase [Gemmatimonadota bacterium]